MRVEADPSVEGLWRASRAADWSRPHVAVVGGAHGDEPCGVRALERLLQAAREDALPAFEGTLFLLHANPEATRQGTRFSRGGVDLNRLFDYAFIEQLSRAHWSYEHERAQLLRPLLDSLDALVDLHSASRPTPAFAIATELPASAALAAALGCEYAVRGWVGPGMLGHRVMLAPLDARGAPSVAVECGAHDAHDAADKAYAVALAFLRHVAGHSPEAPPPRWLRLYDAIRKPSKDFRFAQPWAGFQRVAPGAVIGRDQMLELTVREAGFLVMPNDSVPVGDDMAYLAREQG